VLSTEHTPHAQRSSSSRTPVEHNGALNTVPSQGRPKHAKKGDMGIRFCTRTSTLASCAAAVTRDETHELIKDCQPGNSSYHRPC
jgi:hypothetical protein